MQTLMIVDDSPAIRKITRRILESAGLAVAEATDGLDALEKCEQRMPDAVIVDWDMPRMSGIEFIRALRGSRGGEKVKIIYSTCEVMMNEMRAAKHAGCNEFLIKPFTRNVLHHKVNEIGLAAA